MTRSSCHRFFEQISRATYGELFSMWMIVNIICTVWYFGLATAGSSSAPTQLAEMNTTDRLFNSFYFSIITATSIGYGDITPLGFSKVLAMLQAISALMIFALFVSKLVSRRQDTILEEVHRMMAENMFANIRQGLFIVRKDFDALIEKLTTTKKLNPPDWDLLATTYLHAQNLIEEIPNLYNGQGDNLYVIDSKREKLLLESIDRTIRRMETLVLLLNKQKIDWKKHKESVGEYKTLITTIPAIMTLWRKHSKTKKDPKFDAVMKMVKRLG